jgi:hypothetical protein
VLLNVLFFLPILRHSFVYNLLVDHGDQLPLNTYLSVINNFSASNQEKSENLRWLAQTILPAASLQT